jgi:hypothetical protein
MKSWLELDHRSYVIVRDAQHGLQLMRGHVRLRIDRRNGIAALVGEVSEVINDANGFRAFNSIWTPVPLAIAEQMAASLHKIVKETVGDSRGGRIGYAAFGYDGEVADWYCHKQ